MRFSLWRAFRTDDYVKQVFTDVTIVEIVPEPDPCLVRYDPKQAGPRQIIEHVRNAGEQSNPVRLVSTLTRGSQGLCPLWVVLS